MADDDYVGDEELLFDGGEPMIENVIDEGEINGGEMAYDIDYDMEVEEEDVEEEEEEEEEEIDDESEEEDEEDESDEEAEEELIEDEEEDGQEAETADSKRFTLSEEEDLKAKDICIAELQDELHGELDRLPVSVRDAEVFGSEMGAKLFRDFSPEETDSAVEKGKFITDKIPTGMAWNTFPLLPFLKEEAARERADKIGFDPKKYNLSVVNPFPEQYQFVFGNHPLDDKPHFVRCKKCDTVVRAAAFDYHYEHAHIIKAEPVIKKEITESVQVLEESSQSIKSSGNIVEEKASVVTSCPVLVEPRKKGPKPKHTARFCPFALPPTAAAVARLEAELFRLAQSYIPVHLGTRIRPKTPRIVRLMKQTEYDSYSTRQRPQSLIVDEVRHSSSSKRALNDPDQQSWREPLKGRKGAASEAKSRKRQAEIPITPMNLAQSCARVPVDFSPASTSSSMSNMSAAHAGPISPGVARNSFIPPSQSIYPPKAPSAPMNYHMGVQPQQSGVSMPYIGPQRMRSGPIPGQQRPVQSMTSSVSSGMSPYMQSYMPGHMPRQQPPPPAPAPQGPAVYGGHDMYQQHQQGRVMNTQMSLHQPRPAPPPRITNRMTPHVTAPPPPAQFPPGAGPFPYGGGMN